MRRKWIVWVCVFLMMSSSFAFAGQLEPTSEGEVGDLDPRLQLLRSIEEIPDSGSHFGNVFSLGNGSFAAAISYKDQVNLMEYDHAGRLINEISGADTSRCAYPIFVFQTSNGDFFTSDGNRLLQTDRDMNALEDLGSINEMSGVIHVRGSELGLQRPWNNGERLIDFYVVGEGVQASDFENAMTSLNADEIQSCIPQGYEYTGFYGFDYGNSGDELNLLVGTVTEMERAIYVLKAEKTILREEGEVSIQLNRTAWIKLALPESASASNLLVTSKGFEVVGSEEGMLRKKSPFGNVLYRFDFSGEMQDSITVPGGIYSSASNGKQSAVVSWLGPDFGNALFLVNWSPDAAGSPKSLIAERSRNGKTLARFRDDGYGLLKTKVDEAGFVDYLAPLKTEEKEVRLQIPLQDLLAKQGDLSRNLVILYGEDRIAIPMSQLDCSSLLAQLPCQDEATVEIHLKRLEDGTIQVTMELFVVEQIDEKTKRVHRISVAMK